jgi:hypothetical protein
MDFKKQLELVHLQWFADVDLAGKVTLLDLAQETLPGGERFLEIAQILTKAKRVPVFQDAHWEEALMATGDMFGREAYLPNGDYRAINDGLDATSGKTDQLTEPVSLYEDRGIVDCELVRIADKAKPGGGLEFRARKDNAHLRGGAIWLGDKMLYGSRSVATPLGIDGLMSRRAKLGDNCIDNGDASAGAVTSALLAGWGADKVCFLYPAAGKTEMVTEEDGGKQLVIGANSKQLWAYVTEFYFRYGMRLMDEAYHRGWPTSAPAPPTRSTSTSSSRCTTTCRTPKARCCTSTRPGSSSWSSRPRTSAMSSSCAGSGWTPAAAC